MVSVGGGLLQFSLKSGKSISNKIKDSGKSELSEKNFFSKYRDVKTGNIYQKTFDEDKKINELVSFKEIKKELDKNKVDYLFRKDEEGYFSVAFNSKHEEKFIQSLNNISSLMKKREKEKSSSIHKVLESRAKDLVIERSSKGKDKHRQQNLER